MAIIGEAAALAAMGAGRIGCGEMLVEVLIYMIDGVQNSDILLMLLNPIPGGLLDGHFGIPTGQIAVADGFDGRLCVPVALIDTGAGFCRFAPGGTGAEVLFPEGPNAALQRTLRIDRTNGLTLSVFLQENAVFAGLFFEEAVPEPNTVRIFSFELVRSDIQTVSHTSDFVFIGPDVSFAGPGAAATALSTGKGQPGFIPWIAFLQTHQKKL